MAKIHPHAVVSPDAKLGVDVVVGPFCIVEHDVVIGDGCWLSGHVTIKAGTTIGQNNKFYEGCVIGGLPQHANPPGPPGRLEIGNGNVFRENVTIHRSLYEDQATLIGNDSFLMVAAHIAHDCVLENRVIIANNTALSGHVIVGERAFISGMVAVHQYCRIGSMAMVGGMARITRDVPPYITVDGVTNRVAGLNLVGLKRNGLSSEQISTLKQAYRLIFRSGMVWEEMLAELEGQFTTGLASNFAPFFRASKRGCTPERRVPAAATVQLPTDPESESVRDDDDNVLRVRAG